MDSSARLPAIAPMSRPPRKGEAAAASCNTVLSHARYMGRDSCGESHNAIFSYETTLQYAHLSKDHVKRQVLKLPFDTVGKSSFFKCKKLLKSGGVYISSDLGYLAQNTYLPLITPIIKPLMGNKKTIFPCPTDIAGSLRLVKKLTEEGRFRAVIDRKYPLERIAEAYRYVETGQKTGNVVITVEHNG